MHFSPVPFRCWGYLPPIVNIGNALHNLELPYSVLIPTHAEAHAMLLDLRKLLGVTGLVSMLGYKPEMTCAWLHGDKAPGQGPRRLIWLLWVMLCRPGAIQTAFDVVSFGRWTSHGSPAMAGKGHILKPEERCIEGGEYP